VNDQPAGRLYVDRRVNEIRLIDIALLPEDLPKPPGLAPLPAVERPDVGHSWATQAAETGRTELAAAAGISATRLARLERLGLVEPVAPGSGTFAAATAERLRRMLRLHADLGVNLTGAAIIVDLLERLEAELVRPRPGR
jgi:hypothetical protein